MKQKASTALIDISDLTPIVESLGSDQFADNVRLLLKSLFSASIVMLYAFKRTSAHNEISDIYWLGTSDEACYTATDQDADAAAYLNQWWRLDPHLGKITSITTSTLLTLTPSDITDKAMRDFWFDDGRLGESYALAGVYDDHVYELDLMRLSSAEKLSDQQVADLCRWGNLLIALVYKHACLLPAKRSIRSSPHVLTIYFENQIKRNKVKLSNREKQVCLEILMGFTLPHIAERLNIKLSSVQTYADRALVKIGLNNIRDLFNWCFLPAH